jgi:D-alanine-D-alanine ligase
VDEFDSDWWKRIFDQTYLVTDARSVCDEGVTGREVDFLKDALQLQRSWAILDLCGGQGRHSLDLCHRGFEDVTVLDYSYFLLELGKERARKEGLNTRFVRGDARDTCLVSRRFNAIIIMGSSFGYFVDENENDKVLREAFRLLAPAGLLLLDLPNRDYILQHFSRRSWHEADEDILVCRQKSLDKDIIYGRELVLSKSRGMIRDAVYCIRLYSRETITAMLKAAGFGSVRIIKDFVSHAKKSNYGTMTNRMIVVAEKP